MPLGISSVKLFTEAALSTRGRNTKTAVEDKNQQVGGITPSDAGVQAPLYGGSSQDAQFDPQALSAQPAISPQVTEAVYGQSVGAKPWLKWGALAVISLLLVGSVAFVITNAGKRDKGAIAGSNATQRFATTDVGLKDIHVEPLLNLSNTKTVVINGTLTVKEGLIVAPTVEPANAEAGQIYYDINSNTLAYYNGTSFVSVGGNVVKEINDLTGKIPLGAGLADINGQLVNTGVLSVQGQTGNVTLTAGSGITINGTTVTNNGIISVTSASPTLTATNDGNGNVTLTLVGGGTGTITSLGGTPGRIAKFTTAQNIEDSLLSESGATVTVNGNLTVTGGVTLSSPLTVANGGTGAATLAANGVLVGNGGAAITSVVSGVAGMCLVSTAGAPAWATCSPPSSTVNSLNGLTGTLTIANATGLVDTITIDDASTSNKGIVQFNGTNFSVSNGIANTAQDINTTAAPTFSSLTLSGDIAVNGGDITSTGALNITPAGALTAGSTNQALTLQGNASTVFTAASGGNTTTVSFQAPTANVTYRFATAAVGSYDICTTAGNCGVGGSITGSGTAGTLPVFTGATAIGDSLVSQSGATVTINGNLNLTLGNQFQINGTQISSSNLSNDSNLAKLNASQTFTGNNVAFQNGSNSATAFTVQNAVGNRIATVDTSGGELELGQGSTIGGRLVFNNASNANTLTLVSANVTANRTITFPDDTGTVCLDTGNCSGAGATLQTSYNNSTNPEIVLDATRGALTLRDNSTPIGANLFEVQDNAGGTTFFAVSASGTSITQGLTVTGTTNVNTTGTAATSVGNGTGALTLTGSSGSTFVLNGSTVDATEFNRLDGKDAALVDINDAVNTAITGTGALNAGSITSGFGSIDTGADNITTTGTLQGTTGVLTQSLDRTSAGALNIGATTATSIVLGQNTSLTGASTFTSGTGTVLLQGNADVANTVSFATKRGATYTTAGSSNDVALNVASLYILDTSGAAQTITGIAAGRDGQYLTLVNGDAALAVTISNNSGSSLAANRISTGTGADVSLASGASINLVYDTASSLWRVVGGVAGGVGTCATCANQQLSNLTSVNINAALNATGVNLDLTTTTSGNIVLNSAGTIELQDNTNVTGTLGVSSTLTVTAGGASIAGNTTIASTAGNTLGLGNSTGSVTVTGSSGSTFVINGVTVDATEFNRLDGKDAALVDTNDAVNTAITGTGALNAGSITSGFGSIDTGADNITTTGTLQGTTSVLTQSLDRTSAGALNIGATTATSIVLGQNTSLTGAATFTSGTGTVLLQGNTDVAATVSLATKRGTTYTTAGSANDVALNVASLYLLDTSGAAQTITGIAAGRDGQYLTLVNIDPAQTVTLSNNSGSSLAANRITTGTGADITIPIGGSINLIYDSASSLWRVVGGVAGGNGTCSGCANTALSNLSSVNINTALNATGVNLDLTTTTSGNIVLNSAGTIELQDNTNVTGTLGVSSTLTVTAGGASIAGNTTIASTAGNTLGLGNSTGAVTVTGSSGSTFVINGVTVDATEFNRLDGKDAALVDTNDAVNTAITGTGALGSGSITSGFGSIDTGADNITTTGTLQGTTGVLTQSLDRTSAGALNIGATTATSIVLGQNTSLTGVATFTSGTGTVLLQGNTDVAATVSFATKAGTTYTTPGSANDVALNVASLYILDTSGAAQTITGIAAGRDGQYLTLVNADAALPVTISNNSGSSAAANRITTGTGADIALPVGGSVTLIYDSISSLWRVGSGVAGGVGTCSGCANTALSNLSGVNINTALNATSANLNLTTTTSGNIVLNSAGTIELQDNTNVTGTLGVSSTLTVTAGGASIAGNTTIATTAGNTLGLGNSTGSLTVTGSSSSTFVINGVTVDATEFNRLDGKDAALVDTNDAVNTAITGTGALGAGSITSGFGAIDTGADNITTTGTLQGTTSVLTQSLDRTTAGALNIGSTTATSIVLGQNTSLTGAATFTSGTGTVLLQGNTDVANTVSFATKRGTTYTTPGSANDVALNVASLYVLDTSGAAQTITGIAAGRDGQYVTLVNGDASLAVTISNNSLSSAAANRITTGTGADVSIPTGGSISLVYDTAASLWRAVGGVAGGTCLTCANTALSNLASVNINSALNATSANLNLTTTTSGNIILNSAGTIDLQDNTSVSGTSTFSVGTGLTTLGGGLTASGGAIQLNTSGSANTSIGNATGTFALTSAGLNVTTLGALSGITTISTSSTINSQTISNAASLTGTLTVANNLTLTAGDIAVNGGDITSTGALNITPGGLLTVGASTQTLTLQGDASTTLKATSGVNTTTVDFTAPTANTNLRFPALSAGTYNICTSSGNCAGAGVTLQTAYNNSTNPELTLGSAATAGITIRDNATPIAGNLLEVQNNGASTTFFAVTNAGIQTTGTNVSSGNINTTGGTLQTNSLNRIDNSGNLVNIGNLTATGAITISSTGATNDIILNSADTIELQDATNVTGAFSTSSTITLGALGTTDTATYLCRNSSNILAACNTTGAGAAFVQGGNLFGATATLGTNDNFGLDVRTNSTTRLSVGAGGGVLIQGNATADELEVGDDIFNLNDANSRINLGSSAGDSYIRMGESSLAFGFVGWQNSANVLRLATFGAQDLRLETNSTSRLTISGAGVTTIAGTGANGVAGFNVDSTQNTTTGLQPGNILNATINPGGTASASYFGNQMTVAIGAAGTTFTGDIIANLGQVNWSGAGNTSNTGKLYGTVGKVVTAASSGSVQNAVALFSQLQYASTVTNSYNVYASNLQSGSTTNLYGFYAEQMTGGTNNYPLYLASGTANQPLLSVNGTGATTLRNSTNSVSAFQLQNAAGTPGVNVDTTNVNLLANTSFETDTTGWAAKGAATLSRVTTEYYDGNAAMQAATTTAAGDGAKYAYGLASSTQYTLSVYAKSSAGFAFNALEIGRSEDGSTDTSCSTNQAAYGGFARYTCTFTTGTVSGSPYIYIKQVDTTARNLFIDAVQLEAGATVTNYRSAKVSVSSLIVNGGTTQLGNDNAALRVVTPNLGDGFHLVGAGSGNVFTNIMLVTDGGGSTIMAINDASRGTSFYGGSSFFNNAALTVVSTDAGAAAQTIQGASGQTVNILKVQDSGSNNLLTVGPTSGSLFGTKTDSTVGTTPKGVATGDFDKDGDLDYVVTNSGSANAYILLNNGSGVFSAGATLTTGTTPRGVVTGDFDKDGDIDIAVVNNGSNTLSVFLNTGAGAFAAPATPSTGASTSPVAVAIGDFDRDGDPDLAVTAPGTDVVVIMTNNGSGTFASASSPSVGAGCDPGSIVATDTDKDGDLDLLANCTSFSTLHKLTNNGSATFTDSSLSVGTGNFPSDLAAGDLDKDGDADFVATNSSTGKVYTFMNDGTGTYTVGTSYAIGTTPQGVSLGDVDKDGDLDIVATNSASTTVSILINLGNGTFLPKTDLTTGTTPWAVATGDFDKDGAADILVTNSGTTTASVFLTTILAVSPTASPTLTLYTGGTNDTLAIKNADGTQQLRVDAKGNLVLGSSASVTYSSNSSTTATNSGLFADKALYSTPASADGGAYGDFNNDGKMDMAVSGGATNMLSVFLGTGNGKFGTRADYTNGSVTGFHVTAIDINKDGDLDLAVTNRAASTISIFSNNGSGVFSFSSNPATGTNPEGVVAVDVDKDGDVDLVTANGGAGINTVSVLTNNGSGTFAVASSPAAGTSPEGITAGDFDKDGDPDLAVVDSGGSAVQLLTNNGSGTFSSGSALTTNTTPLYVTTADFDKDGDLDLAVTNFGGSKTMSVFINNGSGSFAAKVDYTTGTDPAGITSADFNQDGYMDVAVSNYSSTSISIFIGTGTGTFATKADATFDDYAYGGLAAADFDNDGDPDLASGTENDNLAVIFNTTLNDSRFKILSGDGSVTNFEVNDAGVYVGSMSADGTGALLVLDTKNTTGDPTGTNGAMYYNSFYGRFRCYQNSAWVDCISGGSREYLRAEMRSIQNSNLSSNVDHLKFANVQASAGGSVSLDTATTYTSTGGAASLGRFTLAAGKTYRMVANIPYATATVSGTISTLDYSWYNATTGTLIGSNGGFRSAGTAASNDEHTGYAEAIFTPSSTTLVEVRLTVASNIATIGYTTTPQLLYPSAYIEVLSDGGSGGATAAEYLRAENRTQQLSAASEADIDDHIKFANVQASSGSSITLDTTSSYVEGGSGASVGRFTLAAGKTYMLRGDIPFVSFSADAGYASYAWWDITNGVRIGSAGSSVPATYSATKESDTPYAEGIITTSATTIVELRLTDASSVTAIGYMTSPTFAYPSAFIEVLSDGTKIAQFQGATASLNGQSGYVPMPTAGQQGSLLLGDGTWSTGVTVLSSSLGIGIASPTSKLHVYEDTTGGASLAMFRDNVRTAAIEILAIGGDTPLIRSGAADSLNFATNNSSTVNLSLGTNGAATFQNTTDSTTAFNVNNSLGNSVLSIDTSGYNQNNLITNPSFETNTTGWALKGTATISRDTTQKYSGNASLKYVLGASGDGAKYNVTLADSTDYSISFFAKLDSASADPYGGSVAAGYASDGSTETDASCNYGLYFAGGVWSTHWVQVTCTFKTPASHSGTPYFYIESGDSAGAIYYVDGVLLQTNANTDSNFREGKISLQGTIVSPLVVQNATDTEQAFAVQNSYGSNVLSVSNYNAGTYNESGIANSDFEMNTTGWSAVGTGTTISRATTTAWSGKSSLKISTGTVAGSGAKYVMGRNGVDWGDDGRITFFVRASTGTITDITASYSWDGNSASEAADTCSTSPIGSVTTGWREVYCWIGSLGAGTPTASAYIIIKQTGTTAQTFYIDAVALEQDYGDPAPPAYGGGTIMLGGVVTTPAMFRNAEDSDMAFAIQGIDGNSVFRADTENRRLYVGDPNTSSYVTSLIIDSYNGSGTSPASVNGAIIYDTTRTTLRCYENGIWQDCAGTRAIYERRWGYVTMTTTTATALTAVGANTRTTSGTLTNNKNAESAYVNFATAGTAGSDGGVIGSFTDVERRYSPKMMTRIRVDGTSVGASTRYWVGMFESTPMAFDPPTTSVAQTVDYFGVGYRDTVNGGKWVCASGDGTNTTGTDTGVTVTANHYYDILLDVSTGVLMCSISDNGGAWVTLNKGSANLPGTSVDLGMVAAVRSVTAVARAIAISYMYYERL